MRKADKKHSCDRIIQNFSHHSIAGWWEIYFAVLAYIRVFDNEEEKCKNIWWIEKIALFLHP